MADFRRNSDAPGTTLTPIDSVDIRMLNTFAAHANFTYEVREPSDGQWGVEKTDGNWTGIVGTLQYHLADFSLIIAVTPGRLQVMHFSCIYHQAYVAIFSLKPETLPQNLAIIRPFTGMIWLVLFASILVWSVTLWLLQKVWSGMSGGRGLELSSAFLYIWSVLLEKWTFDPPPTFTSRMLVGPWLLVCTILTIAYRSSLVAHLVMQDKLPEINTFQDLLVRRGWQWGMSYKNSSLNTVLETHPNSDVQKIERNMQYAQEEDQFQRVLKGGYSYITYQEGGIAAVATRYTNSRGYTPIHVSRTGYREFAGDAWGFRRGAPFLPRISRMIQNLLEAGFVDYWQKEMRAGYMRKRKLMRKGKAEEEDAREIVAYEYSEVDDGQVVLGLNHLQGAFYLLLLGGGLSILLLLWENLTCHHGRFLHPQA
ncbi:glutamate receptor ionotropic, kainate glr-3-like [Panulirus ornatus]|uniref:glutamate receptor ionotropic, kainate glr-3-like n=1 Tax=Panulirus ornatus TaxID=150431 RepID=UPI003A88DC79